MLSCERALMSEVDVKNCIRFYTTADEIGATELKNHCSQLISTHWVTCCHFGNLVSYCVSNLSCPRFTSSLSTAFSGAMLMQLVIEKWEKLDMIDQTHLVLDWNSYLYYRK